MNTEMTIGQLSLATGVNAKTIRYYEESGLLPKPVRRKNGYRRYGERDVHILRFVKRARDLGFSVEDAGSLLALWQDKSRKSRDVKKLALGHLQDIERKIAELEGLKDSLHRLVTGCQGDEAPDCPILDDLISSPPCH